MIIYLFGLLGLANLSWGSTAPLSARSFYRSPQSLFASGQANPLDLERRKLRQYQELAFQVMKDGRTLRVTTDALLRDVDLSYRIVNTRTGEIGLVRSTKGAWADVKIESTQKILTWPMTDVQPIPDDLGLAIPLVYIQMRRAPDWKSEYLQEIFPLTRLRVRQFKSHWAEVQFLDNPSQFGWVDIGALVLKHDFATFAISKDSKWTPVRHRQAQHLISGSGERIEIENVKALMTRPDIALVSEEMATLNLRLRSFVHVLSWEYITWAISRLPGHGEVFWKASAHENILQSIKKDEILSFDEILKRPIFSVAFDAKNPRNGVISAEGVYLTEDGITWRKIPQFQSENLPVALSEKELFVGPTRSIDGGKTFSNYLKWEQVTSLIEGQQKRSPRILRLVRIQPLEKQRIAIEVDNGIKTERLLGSTKFGLVMNWELDSSEKGLKK